MRDVRPMFIKKVGISADEITIQASDDPSSDTSKSHELKSRAEAEPGFYKAMAALEKGFREIMMLPEDYREGAIEITSVRWTQHSQSGIKGVVITGRIQLETSFSPANISTPHLPYKPYNSPQDDGEPVNQPIVPIALQNKLTKLEGHVLRYYNGERAQTKMDM